MTLTDAQKKRRDELAMNYVLRIYPWVLEDKYFKENPDKIHAYLTYKDAYDAGLAEAEGLVDALIRLQSPQTGDWKKSIIETALAKFRGEK